MNPYENASHVSVLLQETVDSLILKPGDVVIDGTLGGGGHTEALAKKFGTSIRIIGLDWDEHAINKTTDRLSKVVGHFTLVHDSYRNLDVVLAELGIEHIGGMILDLGFSSFQLEASGRGFSFQKDEPLLMTFGEKKGTGFTAKDILNTWSEESIANVIYGYGEETKARKIAKAIVEARYAQPLETTGDLVRIIENTVGKMPSWMRKIHPATKTFQALRIAVNDELQAVSQGLEKAFVALRPEGRIAVISFHSLEDRIVKQTFKKWSDEGKADIVTKKPLIPTDEEVQRNPRSRSAKLRVISKR